MTKYSVTETVVVSFVYEIEAGSEQEAISIVHDLSTSDANQDYWDWDSVKYDVEETDSW